MKTSAADAQNADGNAEAKARACRPSRDGARGDACCGSAARAIQYAIAAAQTVSASSAPARCAAMPAAPAAAPATAALAAGAPRRRLAPRFSDSARVVAPAKTIVPAPQPNSTSAVSPKTGVM